MGTSDHGLVHRKTVAMEDERELTTTRTRAKLSGDSQGAGRGTRIAPPDGPPDHGLPLSQPQVVDPLHPPGDQAVAYLVGEQTVSDQQVGIDLAQVQHTELVLQPVRRLIDKLLMLGGNAVGIPDLETTRALLEVDVESEGRASVTDGGARPGALDRSTPAVPRTTDPLLLHRSMVAPGGSSTTGARSAAPEALTWHADLDAHHRRQPDGQGR
jgi:hypothetical protein